ncbi:MAG TPA: response regulator [Polyangiaceae bacterium]|nr:response regulator [Polyangiaceae bacterium]
MSGTDEGRRRASDEEGKLVAEEAEWLRPLRKWSERLKTESAKGCLGPALDLLLVHLPARAAVLLVGGRIVADRVAPDGPLRDLSERASLEIDQQVRESGRPLDIPDTRRGPFQKREDGVLLHTSGYTSARAEPLLHGERVLGTVLVWFDETLTRSSDHETLLGLVVNYLGLAIARDLKVKAPAKSLATLGEMNRLAALGQQLESATHALRSPTSSLVIQIDELRHFLDELNLLIEPSDVAAGEVLSTLGQTVEDMAIAAAAVRRELSRLNEISDPTDAREVIQVSALVHEALTIARPELEQRGFTVEENVTADGSLNGDRHNLLLMVLGLLFAIGRDRRIGAHNPVLSAHLDRQEHEIVLRIAARDPTLREITSVPTAPDNCMRIASVHGGDVVSYPGTLEVRLPQQQAATRSSEVESGTPPRQRVLLVDDDPMFTRALRRALQPHDVRICATAAEAEITLVSGDFEPDLVVCDLWLPGSSGRALHERIAGQLPRLASRFVFVSGAPFTSRDGEYFTRTGCPYLTKPLQVEDLFALLARQRESERGAVVPA